MLAAYWLDHWEGILNLQHDVLVVLNAFAWNKIGESLTERSRSETDNVRWMMESEVKPASVKDLTVWTCGGLDCCSARKTLKLSHPP